MQISNTARAVALDTLQKWQKQNAFSNLLLHQQLQQSELDNRDKRLVTELVYGVIQRLNTLDNIIGQLVQKKKVDLWVRQLLQLSLYQLIFLDKIPERAVVHEAVELAKFRGNIGVSKFVNGVLRAFLRRKKEFDMSENPTNIKERSFTYSFPEWIVKQLSDTYGPSEADLVMAACNVAPKISIRVNSLRQNREEFIANWQRKAEKSLLSEQGVILSGIGNAANLPGYAAGKFTIQDESSMLVASILDPKPGMRVLDACAAPGGKTTHLAEKMNNDGKVIALDLHPHKVKLIAATAARLGISIVEAIAADARKWQTDEPFDAVLLDAPCSGLGVIPRKPDIKWRKSADEVAQLVQIQSQLLEAVAPLVKSGGVLVYSTCTWTLAENQQQMEQFLAKHPEYMPAADFNDVVPAIVRERAIRGESWIQLLPHHFHSDGFFIAKLNKK